MICEGCGRSTPIIPGLDGTSQNEYKRRDHFSDWLERFQAKENKIVPKEIIRAVMDNGIYDREGVRQ